MKYLIFTATLLTIISIPCISFSNDKDNFLKEIENLNENYRNFVFNENDKLSRVMYSCNSSFFVDSKCVNIISEIKDLTFKILVETDSIIKIYKTLVYSEECLNDELKINLYSTIYHARNEYGLMQLDLQMFCSEYKEKVYLSERCSEEEQFNNKFVEITDYILNNMNYHIDLSNR